MGNRTKPVVLNDLVFFVTFSLFLSLLSFHFLPIHQCDNNRLILLIKRRNELGFYYNGNKTANDTTQYFTTYEYRLLCSFIGDSFTYAYQN